MHRVGIVLYNGVDEFELSAPMDILSSCRTIEKGHWTEKQAFSVKTVADNYNAVETSHGLHVTPQGVFGQLSDFDIIVVPGGPGARLQKYPIMLLDWLVTSYRHSKSMVCLSTAAFILARSGMLSHRRITTYPAFVADIRRIEPTATVSGHERVISDQGGALLSTSGISQAVDASLALIERFEGLRSAEIAAKRIGWPVNLSEIIPVYST